jgi:phospholipid/cholesterol/gamma-HCH transport system permease protein
MTIADLPQKATLEPTAQWSDEAGEAMIRLSGPWIMAHAKAAEQAIATIEDKARTAPRLSIDLGAVRELDTLGSWLISRLGFDRKEGESVRFVNARAEQGILLQQIAKVHHVEPPRRKQSALISILADIGLSFENGWRDLVAGIAFLGGIIAALGRLVLHPSRFRLPAVVNQVEQIALRGVPIVALISFLVGAIVAQQAVYQLQRFGSAAFVADLLGILVLRELAILLSAIMVAGRSGSAFTAEIGSMKMREEIDALRTMGLDPMEVLIVPRIIALMISLPILTFISALAGLTGGGLVAVFYGDVSSEVFLLRLQSIIGFNTFMVGLIKAPFMALVIGLIACLEGLKVAGSAESLGRHTTASVVKSIFVVIIVDGLFAMFFAAIRY